MHIKLLLLSTASWKPQLQSYISSAWAATQTTTPGWFWESVLKLLTLPKNGKSTHCYGVAPMSYKNICHAALVIFSIGQQSGSAANPTFLFVSKSPLTDSQMCCVRNMKQPFSIFMKNTNTNTWRVSGHLFSQQGYDSQRLSKVTFGPRGQF